MDFVETIMNSMDKYGIDALLVVASVFATAMLKAFDRKNRFKVGYVVFPLIASAIVTALSQRSLEAVVSVNTFVYAGLSAWAYDLYAKMIKPRVGRSKKDV